MTVPPVSEGGPLRFRQLFSRRNVFYGIWCDLTAKFASILGTRFIVNGKCCFLAASLCELFNILFLRVVGGGVFSLLFIIFQRIFYFFHSVKVLFCGYSQSIFILCKKVIQLFWHNKNICLFLFVNVKHFTQRVNKLNLDGTHVYINM